MNEDALLKKINQLLGKNYKYKSYLETIGDLVVLAERQQREYATLIESVGEADVMIMELQNEVAQCKLQEFQLIAQLKEAKQNSRLMKFYAMAEENLKLAQENAQLKEMVNAVSQH